jgi:hypothetical protein
VSHFGYYVEPATHPSGLIVVPRDEFVHERWNYKKGEHVVFGGRSTGGKTKLCFDLLAVTCSPTLPAYVAQSKPLDKETREGADRLDFRVVKDWPPNKKVKELWDGKPRGYLVYPPFGDLNEDMERCAKVTGKLLDERYSAGAKGQNGILVMDDTMVKAKIMGLDSKMVTILAMAGAMGMGEWIFVQKPTDSGRTTLWGYENSIHCFFTRGGDARMVKRYAEIGGEHAPTIQEVVPTLEQYQFLYFHQTEGWICIVDKGE